MKTMSTANLIPATIRPGYHRHQGDHLDGTLLDGWWGIQPEPHSGALPDCATPRHIYTITYLRAQQASTPHQRSGKSPHQSVSKSSLKSDTLKCDTPWFMTPQRVRTTPHKSVGVTPSSAKSVITFCRFAFPEAVVTSLMSVQRRFHHEDRAGTP